MIHTVLEGLNTQKLAEHLQKAHKRSQESDYVDLLHCANVPHVVEG